ncbi:hypothetical protein LSCM1_04842 [Leishmania martiniquensis]|uniref:C2H2-type domain-containing protein n=1 Tax=Leishmania martiniquensis TaxID=1580590 RepID=A0A836HFQ2_9TRYP|nr:hypothetical protein LSCM1_04842 [Leishmania martiniquensis]
MTSTVFEFVQGNERLDWRVLVSIDVERLLKSTNVETLQRIVENIAFSRVTRDEASLFSPDHVLHLFQLCQLVIQYLVYSQDILAKINNKLNDRLEGQQATIQEQEGALQRLSDETSLLKKQVKTQRRTLLAYEYNAQAALAHGLASRGAAAAAAGTPAPLYVCPYCAEEYHKAESMQSHLRKRHMMAAAPASFRTGGAATPPPRPTFSDGGAPYHERPASPMPPATGAPTAVPPAATAPTATAEDTMTLQQLRHRVDQLEKDREAMERQQRENLMLMLLGAARSQPASPPPPQQQPQQAAPAPSATGAPPPASPPSPPSVAKTEAAGDDVPAHLRGVPVVPDISAMMSYNLSCQREASENALRRQLVNLEAEIRALRAGKSTAASTELAKASPPPPSSVPALGVTASSGVPAVVRPAWVAELENAQQRQHQQQPSSGSPATLPLAPPPSPPPSQVAATPTTPPLQQHGDTISVTGPSLVPPPSHSQTPSLSVPSPLQPSSPAPPPSSATPERQQPSPTVPPPVPSVLRPPTAAVLIPSPVTAATTKGKAPAAPTPTPSVSTPQLPKVHQKPGCLLDSSTNSSLTSTSTVPPHRAVSKGPPGASISLTSDAPAPTSASASPGAPGSAASATATMAFASVTPIPLPSTTSASSLATPVPFPGPGVGPYFSSRPSPSAAAVPVPALLPITPPPATHSSTSPAQQHSYTAQSSTASQSVSSTHPGPTPPVTTPPLPVPVVAGGTGGNSTTVSGWSPPAPVLSTASVPVPASAAVPLAVRPFRQSSSSSSSDSQYSIGGWR